MNSFNNEHPIFTVNILNALYENEINQQPRTSRNFKGFLSPENPQLNLRDVRPRARRTRRLEASQSSQPIPLYLNNQEGLNARQLRLVESPPLLEAPMPHESRIISSGHPRARIIGGYPNLSPNAIQRFLGPIDDIYKKQRLANGQINIL
jgi:hypothetical protein